MAFSPSASPSGFLSRSRLLPSRQSSSKKKNAYVSLNSALMGALMDIQPSVANHKGSSTTTRSPLEFGLLPIGINHEELTKHSITISHADPRTLSATEVKRLSRDLLQVYEGGFLLTPTADPSQIIKRLDDLTAHLGGAQRVLIARSEGGPVGFLCSRLLDLSVGKTYHLQGLVCHPSVQGQGLGQLLLETDVSQSNAAYMYMHTQSMKMFRLFSRVAAQSEEVARMLAPAVTDSKLDGLVARERYHGRCLYGDVEAFTKFALPGINGAQGDAMFVAGKVSRSSA